MKLRRLALAKTRSEILFVNGAVTVATSILLRYQAVTAPSPNPITFTCPASSICETVSFAELYLCPAPASHIFNVTIAANALAH